MKTSRYNPSSYNAYSQFEQNCPQNQWVYCSPSALTGIFPPSLLEKVDKALIMRSANYIVTVISRIDQKATALDQDLHVATFHPQNSAAEACFVYHGNWSGRTTSLDNTAFSNLPNLPSAPSGTIEHLGEHGIGLLNTGISALQNCK